MPEKKKKSALFTSFLIKEKKFFLFIGLALIFTALIFPYPPVAMWVGFLFAGYSAIANDSIQTIGTFIASNTDKKWYVLWLYIGGIFVVTVFYSWYYNDGDVSYSRLLAESSDGELLYPEPKSFVYLQVAAPVILLVLTRLKMPVSTTFLLLSSFTVQVSGITKVLFKSISGYGIAFIIGLLVWYLFSRLMKDRFTGKPKFYWTILQWITSGALWSFWVMHDAANIAVYLPRSMGNYEFMAFAGVIFLGLGVLFYSKGDKIQEIVTEKSSVRDVRPATIIDFIYAIIIFGFKEASNIPMSTTWVFLGLLGGRELGMALQNAGSLSVKKTWRVIRVDLGLATFGFIVSLILALAVNPTFREMIF